MHFFRIALFSVVLALMALPCSAKIYKYQKSVANLSQSFAIPIQKAFQEFGRYLR